MKASRLYCILFSITVLAANTQAQDDGLDMEDLFEDDFESSSSSPINDPLEGLNRAIFNFNDGLYTHIAKPFARGYANVVPDPVEKSIDNVFTNLKYPSRLVGSLLQGKVKRAGTETGMFLVNSTVGIGGLFKASDEFDLEAPKEDMGQAFASWGIGHGFYFVMPFTGPTSFRDLIGDVADGAVEPIPQPWTQVEDSTERLGLRAVEAINELPGLMDLYDSMSRSSIDKYAAVRDGYTQRRAKQVEE